MSDPIESDSPDGPLDLTRFVLRWERRVEKLRRKKKKTNSLHYETLYQGKIMQLMECISEIQKK